MNEKDRVQVVLRLSKPLAERIDYYCDKMGMTRSAFCTQAIGEKIMQYDKSFEMVESVFGNRVKDNDVSSMLKALQSFAEKPEQP